MPPTIKIPGATKLIFLKGNQKNLYAWKIFKKRHSFHPERREVMQNAKGNTYNNRKISTKTVIGFLKGNNSF